MTTSATTRGYVTYGSLKVRLLFSLNPQIAFNTKHVCLAFLYYFEDMLLLSVLVQSATFYKMLSMLIAIIACYWQFSQLCGRSWFPTGLNGKGFPLDWSDAW